MLRIGYSSYSFFPLLRSGEMAIEDVFAFARETGAEHVELAAFPFGTEDQATYDLPRDKAMLARLKAVADDTGIPVSGLCIGADFGAAADRQAEIDRVKRHVEATAELGAGFLRHDVVLGRRRKNDIADLAAEFDGLVTASREIAEFAAGHGVVTSLENHGFFMNSSERVLRLVHAVAHDNFGLTLDVGNFLCLDEDALVATRRCLAVARFVHLKDFYVRRHRPGPGWIETPGGRHLLGAIVGFGDLDTRGIAGAIVQSGYEGFVSIEFEGNEPSRFAARQGLENLKTLLAA